MMFPQAHYDAVRDSVMVSGIFRGGTTILGKIIGSFKNTEYSFEPALAYHLDAMLQEKKIKGKAAAELLMSYLASDVMIDFHHGRGYNMRPNDDSCIFGMKTKEEVMERWGKVKGTRDAVALMKNLGSRLVFKCTATYSIIPALFENFPGFKVVETQRNLESILSSLIAKGWFSNETLDAKNYPGIWPVIGKGSGILAPYLLGNSAVSKWAELNPEARAVKVLNCVVEKGMEMRKKIAKKHSEQFLVSRYEDILQNPLMETERIAGFLGMELTEKTREIVRSVKPTQRAFDADVLLSKCDDKSRKEFLANNKLLGYVK